MQNYTLNLNIPPHASGEEKIEHPWKILTHEEVRQVKTCLKSMMAILPEINIYHEDIKRIQSSTKRLGETFKNSHIITRRADKNQNTVNDINTVLQVEIKALDLFFNPTMARTVGSPIPSPDPGMATLAHQINRFRGHTSSSSALNKQIHLAFTKLSLIPIQTLVSRSEANTKDGKYLCQKLSDEFQTLCGILPQFSHLPEAYGPDASL